MKNIKNVQMHAICTKTRIYKLARGEAEIKSIGDILESNWFTLFNIYTGNLLENSSAMRIEFFKGVKWHD